MVQAMYQNLKKLELPQLLRDHDQLRAGGQAVQTADPASRMLRLIMLLCLDRRVIAAGKAAGDGQGKYAVGVSEGVQPFLNIGAGGAGASLVGGEIGEHFLQVQLRIIHEFLLVGDDLQRHAGKAGHTQDRRRSRQSLSVQGDDQQAGRRAARGDREHRHRRTHDD